MTEYDGPEDLLGDDEKEHRKIYIRNRKQGQQMANGNNGGAKIYETILKLMQPAIVIALAVVGWGLSDIKGNIALNADILRRVEGKQIAVIEKIKKIEDDLLAHESQAAVASATRSQYHHTEIRSCLQCKTREHHPVDMLNYKKRGNKE